MPAERAFADEVIEPAGDILHRLEIERELAWPVRQYAVIAVAAVYQPRNCRDGFASAALTAAEWIS